MMKFNSPPPQLSAEFIFTDRKEPRDVFWDTLAKYQKAKRPFLSPVIHYYGVGGIGKSWLLKWLVGELKQRDPKIKSVDHGFGFEGKSDILIALRNTITNKYPKMKFKRFDLAYFYYLVKNGEDKNSPNVSKLIEGSSILKTLIRKFGNVEMVANAIGDFGENMDPKFIDKLPIISLIQPVLGILDGAKAYYDYKKLRNSEDMRSYFTLEKDKMLESLPFYFALDLNESIEDETSPFIIFLDGYEFIQYQNIKSIGKLDAESVLWGEYGLMRYLNNVIWVLFGRDRINEDNYIDENKIKRDSISQHLIGNLSEHDSYDYLDACGIYDSTIKSQIYKRTSGLPIFLDSFVNYIKAEQWENKDVEITDISSKDMIKLYKRYTELFNNDEEMNLIFILSCLPYWDDQRLYSIITEGLKISFNFAGYDRLKEMSFINSNNAEVNCSTSYSINPEIRRVFYKKCPAYIKKKLQEYLQTFKDTKLKIIEKIDYNDEQNTLIEYPPEYNIDLADLEWYTSARLLIAIEEKQLKEFYEVHFDHIQKIIMILYLNDNVDAELDKLILEISYKLLRDEKDSIEIAEILTLMALQLGLIKYNLIRSRESDALEIESKFNQRIQALSIKAIEIIDTQKNISMADKMEYYIYACNGLLFKENGNLIYRVYSDLHNSGNCYDYNKFHYIGILVDLVLLSDKLSKTNYTEQYIIDLLNTVLLFKASDMNNPSIIEEKIEYSDFVIDDKTTVYLRKMYVPYDTIADIYLMIMKDGKAKNKIVVLELLNQIISDISNNSNDNIVLKNKGIEVLKNLEKFKQLLL